MSFVRSTVLLRRSLLAARPSRIGPTARSIHTSTITTTSRSLLLGLSTLAFTAAVLTPTYFNDDTDVNTPTSLQTSGSAPTQNTQTESTEEQDQKGAYDPETGEINWDCPCLGGMADGPCGEEFKAAFSCFVYSESDPKGVDCIEKFQAMQSCFRKYPEVYAEELRNPDDDETAASPVPTESTESAETIPVKSAESG
ncbi:hypothetical protein CANCADRAFT_32822 [Tortispora caseinolytica NRRL Y-17796]|uniref:Mitochondrial intermembrane space import and assembly protein 40 n=1 Tax=Tortispora caseinolytica NRRL Y-17796 TaxID=767744 RepID=A0A1E4TD07_9ASCO|nr:hypothetical protein CANCADRAFT_32822 [Tortispora caseinolytica NRRL Y-17796]